MPRTAVVATVSQEAVAAPLPEAARSGAAKFHVRRQDGSTRRMSYLLPGSPARRTAEKVQRMRDDRVPMRAIALSMHVSIPTVRRMINNLELSRQVDAGGPVQVVAANQASPDGTAVDPA